MLTSSVQAVGECEAQLNVTENPELLAFPTSLGQRGFWYLDRLSPGNPSYNISVRFHLSGPLDVGVLEMAFNALIQRHEILRTCFENRDGVPVQVVSPELTIELPVTDLRGVPAPDRAAAAERLAVEDAEKRFDLAALPLFRAGLLRLDDEEYMLLVAMHHTVSDGWSIGVITNEIAVIYSALLEGAEIPLPELPIQYADFAVWQNDWYRKNSLDEHLRYWKQQLAGLSQLEFPTDHPRGASKTFDGHILSRVLPRRITDRLAAFSRARDCTLFNTVFAAFCVLLGRYCGQEDIAVGSQVAGRAQVETEGLIGLFINTLVLRADLSGDPAFADLVNRVRDMFLAAVAHQEMPYEQLVEALQPARDASRNPLYQINFLFQRDFVRPVELGPVKLTPIPSKSPGAIYDLNVFLVERADGWRLSCEYNTRLFDEPSITRMLGHFETLLEDIARDPNIPISRLRLLAHAEADEQVNGWNQTETAFSGAQSVHEWFESQARATPGSIALEFEGAGLTYEALNRRANRLARYLERAGVKPEELVGICVERSFEMVIALLAVLKAGAAYVPMDPAYPRQRIADVVEDASIRFLLTQSLLAPDLPPGIENVICLDTGWDSDRTLAETDLPMPVRETGLAYVIFTSGSTGRPKGVQIPHRAVVNFLESMRRAPGMEAHDVLVAVTTLSFDIAGLELLLPLVVGARVIIASRDEAMSGSALARLLGSGVTVMQGTPATWSLLLDSGWKGTAGLKILCGGEAFPRDLANRLVSCASEVWNMYGPTETTIWSAACRVTAGEGPVLFGGPIANTQLYVLDERLRLLPKGVPGELFIGGRGLARGYLNRPELTAEKFIRDPFRSGEKLMYRTGDLVRRREDGRIEFLGRGDNQVKIRGYRIELGEIEALLAAHPRVREAVVVACGRTTDERRLAAFVVPNGIEPPVSELRAHLTTRLPSYMTPASFAFLEALPLTPNGKVDRKKLSTMQAAPAPAQHAYLAPRTPTEQRLTRIWENLLAAKPIGIGDSYFELGGHSLLAARLFAAIHKEFGMDLPLATLFEAPTIESLGRILDTGERFKPSPSLVEVQGQGWKPPLFVISGLGGNVIRFHPLAKYLGAEQPVYALQPPGLDGKAEFLLDIESMAAFYIEQIRSVQREGPYFLAGYSFGGVVSFEMARQLTAKKRKVAILALIDTPEWRYLHENRRAKSLFARLASRREAVEHLVFGPGRLDFLRTKLRSKAFLLMRRFNRNGRSGRMLASIEDVNLFAASQYVPQTYPGRLTLFRTESKPGAKQRDRELGWGDFASLGVEVYQVPGSHDNITAEPGVRTLAEKMRRAMDVARIHPVQQIQPKGAVEHVRSVAG